MEVVFAAIIGEIASRSISFLFEKYSMQTAPSMEDQLLHNLQRLLLRVRIIVEEAEASDIINHAMVHLPNILRKEMYRGYFIVDSIRCQASGEEGSKVYNVSHPFAPSKFNSAKRLFFSTSETHIQKEMLQVLNNLNNIIVDTSEFIRFLKSCPPLYRQPYNMHLILEKCMFGHQMEMERIMNFLMLVEPPSEKYVSVQPIVGQAKVGKSTLVAHVCNEERVCNYFTQILFITEYDLKVRGLTTFKDGGFVIHQNSSMNENERTLAIIEFPEDIDEDAWKQNLASATCLESVVRIIITSRSNKIINFGTTEALILNLLPPEAYWYFFKVLTFGSADPMDHSKLESIAMDICKGLNGSFIHAHILSRFLRAARQWCMVRASTSSTQCCVNRNKFAYLSMRMVAGGLFAIYPCDGSH